MGYSWYYNFPGNLEHFSLQMWLEIVPNVWATFSILVRCVVTRMEFVFTDGNCPRLQGHLSEGQGLDTHA